MCYCALCVERRYRFYHTWVLALVPNVSISSVFASGTKALKRLFGGLADSIEMDGWNNCIDPSAQLGYMRTMHGK